MNLKNQVDLKKNSKKWFDLKLKMIYGNLKLKNQIDLKKELLKIDF